MKDLVHRSQLDLAARITTLIMNVRNGERGQTTVEWLGIIVVVVALAIALKGQIATVVTKVVEAIGSQIDSL